ncbi:MAG: thiamine pyrophosphokinase [Bifidobacteriaceae bacterium]|jgi:uncharacterized membrane-anchored protein|nr:thiamine pyrophosphokinase [Bifidobacteriaceae bacterium]
MKLSVRRRRPDASVQPDIVGQARVDARTKRLTGRLGHGDIAVIDHEDLDRVAAEALVAAAPAAVLNAARSCSERFPNLGPEVLAKAGVLLIDNLGPSVMAIKEGTEVHVAPQTGTVTQDGRTIAEGDVQTIESVARSLERSKIGLASEMAAFAQNTTDFICREAEYFFDAQDVSDIQTEMKDRHVLIAVRGYDYKQDLAALKPYIGEYRPVAIGVDGGADALLEVGVRPNVIVGDMDSVSDKALKCGAELVVHAYRDGRAPGASRLEALGLSYSLFPAPGTSEDVAMIIADDKKAELIVAVGTHMTMVEFLDKGRAGMSSAILTRLRIGSKLVDAKGVSRLYRSRIGTGQLAMLALVGILALIAALDATTGGRAFLGLVGARWDDVIAWFGGLFG